jgi:hypothetical protein
MIYHYTKTHHLESITSQGLQPTDILLARGEKPVLWFSTNDHWERTVLCVPSLAEAHQFMSRHGEGLVRIACEDNVAPHRWQEIKVLACMPPRIANNLEKAAKLVYADPRQWRCTLDVVPPSLFVAIEQFDGTSWLAMDWQSQVASAA